MKAQQLVEKYDKYELRYGADAPVAMLRWIRTADNSQDAQAQALVPVLEKLLVQRCVAVFEAMHLGELSEIEAYQLAADEARRIIHTASIVEIAMPVGFGEV